MSSLEAEQRETSRLMKENKALVNGIFRCRQRRRRAEYFPCCHGAAKDGERGAALQRSAEKSEQIKEAERTD
ncbi:hypothetical protein INR49_020882 [Caranx melampygus]|nr:hypothetical protein INR49_020882 [Caranx melampygus]